VGEKLQPLDILLTLGPGDITKSGPPILSYYSERKPKYKVGLLYGGESTEHAVSKMSAKNIFHALDKSVYDVTLFGITPEGEWVNSSEIDPLEGSNGQKISPETLGKLSFCDVCIPVLHGPKGEDGMVGAILEALHIPFIGCDFRSGALCMNKVWTKYAAEQNGIKTAPFLEVYRSAYKKNPMSTVEEIEEKLTFPLWVKPVHLGSSIGVNRAENRNDLEEFIRRAFSYDEQILIEEEIEGRQIEFSLLGNEFIRAALPAEIINHGNFVGFDEKYGPGAMEICVPALITEEQKSKGIELSKKMYRACKCQGLARIDFFLDKDGSFWLNEINPFPGFTDTSAYPKAWQGSCMQLEIVLDELIALAFHRARV